MSAESNGLDACRIVLLGVIAADHWQHWSVCAARSGPRTEPRALGHQGQLLPFP